jgi:hypothetical protein
VLLKSARTAKQPARSDSVIWTPTPAPSEHLVTMPKVERHAVQATVSSSARRVTVSNAEIRARKARLAVPRDAYHSVPSITAAPAAMSARTTSPVLATPASARPIATAKLAARMAAADYAEPAQTSKSVSATPASARPIATAKLAAMTAASAHVAPAHRDRAASTSNVSMHAAEPAMQAAAKSVLMAPARCSATPKPAQSVALVFASFPVPLCAAAGQPAISTPVRSAPAVRVRPSAAAVRPAMARECALERRADRPRTALGDRCAKQMSAAFPRRLVRTSRRKDAPQERSSLPVSALLQCPALRTRTAVRRIAQTKSRILQDSSVLGFLDKSGLTAIQRGYLPIQKRLKISVSTASSMFSPVTSPMA